MSGNVTTYVFSPNKLRKRHGTVWNLFFIFLTFTPFLALIQYMSNGSIDWETFALGLLFASISVFVLNKFLFKEPSDPRITLSSEGIHFPSVSNNPMPWVAFDAVMEGDEVETIIFRIQSEFISKNEAILTDAASRVKKRWDLYRLEFMPSLYEREGPSLTEQIRLHAPHLTPPNQEV
jgi:hypothetical protein